MVDSPPEQSVHKDFQEVTVALEGERYRSERLEEQINDLTELHQVCADGFSGPRMPLESNCYIYSRTRMRLRT